MSQINLENMKKIQNTVNEVCMETITAIRFNPTKHPQDVYHRVVEDLAMISILTLQGKIILKKEDK